MKIQYNQQVIDAIRNVMPLNMRKKLHQRINHGKHGAAVISYSQICDVLKTYRNGGGVRYRNRRMKVYDTAIKMLEESGVDVERLLSKFEKTVYNETE